MSIKGADRTVFLSLAEVFIDINTVIVSVDSYAMAARGVKRKTLSLDQRVKVIRLNEQGKSARIIAKEMDVGKTQIGNILKEKKDIMDIYKAGTMSGSRKNLSSTRQAYHAELNDKVYEWFSAVTAKSMPISGRILQEKARYIAMQLGHDDFTATNGWLHSFQKRHGINSSVLSGQGAEVSQ